MKRTESDPFSFGLDKQLVLRLLSGKNLDKKDQAAYHKTDHFKKLKDRVLYVYHTCVVCGKLPDAWTAHHRNYKNLFRECVLTDLCLVCNRCHRKIHGRG